MLLFLVRCLALDEFFFRDFQEASHGAVELLLSLLHDTQDEIARGVALLRVGHLAEARAILESLVSKLDRVPLGASRAVEPVRNAGVWEDWPPSNA